MKKITLILIIINAASKITGFVRDMILSYYYGASTISDAYLISITIPTVIFGLIGSAINTGFIPVLSKVEHIADEEAGYRFTSNLVNILIMICTILILMGLLFTEQIIRIFATGFDPETMELAVQFTKIGLFGVYGTVLIGIFSGFLQLRENYIFPSLIGLLANFMIMISIFLSVKINIYVLSIGTVVASIFQVLFLLPPSFRKGFKYHFNLNFKDQNIKTLILNTMPLVLGVSVNQINILVDKNLASRIAVGGITALTYAERVNGIFEGIFVVSISTIMFPKISKMAAEHNIDGIKTSLLEAVSGISIFVVPMTIGIMIFARPVVSLLFGRGAFDAQDISMTTGALFFYSIGMIGFGLRELLSRVFYSLQDVKTPIKNAVFSMITNIILNLILSRFMGISGLALATSISAIVFSGLLYWDLRKKIGGLGVMSIIASYGKIIAASLFMGLLSWTVYIMLNHYLNMNLSLGIALLTATFVYFVLVYFMKIGNADVLIKELLERIKKGK
ncbi:MAG: murein biosynthesis integral membrane protein MurJ [Eubacteriaceae bacterium]|nr:murein biosynthesis integral membrane protein MurJ [Eubacteriaceae bacterium]